MIVKFTDIAWYLKNEKKLGGLKID